ncbi:MAG: hypothetical protein ABII27_04675 [bacterium]
MVGIALFTHRQLGVEILRAAESIVGPQEKVVVVAITAKDSLLSIKERCRGSLNKLDDGSGILIMTDMLGGSASNACLGLINDFSLEILTGLSLPMLISALINRQRMGLKELANKTLEDAKKSMINAKGMFMDKLK